MLLESLIISYATNEYGGMDNLFTKKGYNIYRPYFHTGKNLKPLIKILDVYEDNIYDRLFFPRKKDGWEVMQVAL